MGNNKFPSVERCPKGGAFPSVEGCPKGGVVSSIYNLTHNHPVTLYVPPLHGGEYPV